MDSDYLYIKPFKLLDFEVKDIILAGEKLTITVKKNWSRAFIDGKVMDVPVAIHRKQGQHKVEFL